MRILGIDPGLNTTGFGVVELDASNVKILEAGVIEPNKKASLEERLFKIHQHISTIIQTNQPDVIVLEKLYAHIKFPATAPILGHVRGVICLAAAQNKVKLIEQSVKRIRKSLLGNGNATKAQTQEFVKRILNIKHSSLKLDASDALALALGQAHMMRYRLI